MIASRLRPERWTVVQRTRAAPSSGVSSSQFGHADDAVHGRADLVAHVGQERPWPCWPPPRPPAAPAAAGSGCRPGTR